MAITIAAAFAARIASGGEVERAWAQLDMTVPPDTAPRERLQRGIDARAERITTATPGA
ncbi:MAG: hypothetical protein KC635_01455 [Myxococcales bacterium]|nr:hypothetical protein [Myxococcales bacterium]